MSASSLLTFFLVVNTIWSYFIRKKWKVVQGNLLTIDDMPTDMKIDMVVEGLINVVMPYPPLYNTTFKEYEYVTKTYLNIRVDTILLFLMFILRFYHVVRPILLNSLYMENRAYRICKIYGHEGTMMFSAKSIFYESAALLMPLMYALFVLIIGTLLHLCELQAYYQNKSLKNFTWFNSFWCTFITMTTVGYGDFFPVTNLGRSIAVLGSFVGVFLSSLFVVGLLKYLTFSSGEDYSYTLLDVLQRKHLMMEKGVSMLTYMFHYNRKKRTKFLSKFSKAKSIFKKVARELRIQKIQTIETNDEIRMQIKSQMIEGKTLINKITSHYGRQNEWPERNPSIEIKISDPKKKAEEKEKEYIVIIKPVETDNQWNTGNRV